MGKVERLIVAFLTFGLILTAALRARAAPGTEGLTDFGPWTVEIFSDGFESGDTGRWSGTVGGPCVPAPEICGDGIDQDCDEVDPACPGNDAPEGATDISAGGTFTVDLGAAHNDQDFAGPACGAAGGRDVFYTFTLPAGEVIYLDTFGSNFDTNLRIFSGSCTALGASMTCFDDACASQQTQGALSLAADTYCLVADQYSSAQTNGSLVLRFTRGGRSGAMLPSSPVGGDSCVGANVTTGTCMTNSTAGESAYYFLACPAQTRTLAANTCTGTAFDSVLYLRRAGSPGDIACNDDTIGCGSLGRQSSFTGASAVGPGLFWLTVDGYLANCGPFTLTYTLN